jgi:hypothetical protein
MAMQLQRDALQAIELLEKYTQESLTEELKYVERSLVLWNIGEAPKEIVKDMGDMKNKALEDLGHLKSDLREQILQHHLNFSSTDLELHDLSPFIPGFTSAQAKSRQQISVKSSASPSTSGSVADLSTSYNLLINSVLTPERTEALTAVENFRDTVNTVAEEFAEILSHGSMRTLEEKVEKMADIQEAVQRMGTGLYRLLNTRGQRDYEGDVGSGSGD